jgi:molybdopterin converting factor subunit 1
MKITIKLFANLKELAGTDGLDLELDKGASVEKLMQAICEKFPGLAPIIEKKAVFISVNQEMAKNSDVLSEGDEVGLLPPFSGG